jgi:hypothetical protein
MSETDRRLGAAGAWEQAARHAEATAARTRDGNTKAVLLDLAEYFLRFAAVLRREDEG